MCKKLNSDVELIYGPMFNTRSCTSVVGLRQLGAQGLSVIYGLIYDRVLTGKWQALRHMSLCSQTKM